MEGAARLSSLEGCHERTRQVVPSAQNLHQNPLLPAGPVLGACAGPRERNTAHLLLSIWFLSANQNRNQPDCPPRNPPQLSGELRAPRLRAREGAWRGVGEESDEDEGEVEEGGGAAEVGALPNGLGPASQFSDGDVRTASDGTRWRVELCAT